MTDSQQVSTPEPEIDKEALYGNYLKSRKWKSNLYRKAAHMALDVDDEDDMKIIIRKGIGAFGTLFRN